MSIEYVLFKVDFNKEILLGSYFELMPPDENIFKEYHPTKNYPEISGDMLRLALTYAQNINRPGNLLGEHDFVSTIPSKIYFTNDVYSPVSDNELKDFRDLLKANSRIIF